ncbi:MAG: ABC transporter substrate-binding protein [Rhodoferax sp.]
MEQFSINRRKLGTLVSAAAASLAMPALRAQPALEKPKLVIAVGGKAAFYYLPLTIADQLGYFKAEGLDVEIDDFAGAAKALQAVVAGSADVCSGAFENTIALQSKGQFYEAFVLQGRAPEIVVGVSTKTLPDYRHPSDLDGKKIGVPALGSSSEMVADLVLARAGIRPAQVSFVGVGASAGALTAMRTGEIDAISDLDPVMTMLEQKGNIRVIADTRTLKGTQEIFGGPMPAGCLYASSAFVQKNPNTCQALANAIVHGLKWLQTAGPGDIIKTVPESYLLGDRALYLATFEKVREAISPDGVIPPEGPKTALRALSSFDPSIKPDKIDLKKIYTNTLALKAKERFKA